MAWTRKRIFQGVYVAVGLYILIFWVILKQRVENVDQDAGGSSNLLHKNVSRSKYNFNAENGDVLVFFHIQRTSGTSFNAHLVNLVSSSPCDCTEPLQEGACRCRNTKGYNWLFSPFTTSNSCGVHPPLADLRQCAPAFLSEADGYDDKERHNMYFATILRDPVERYLSEWRHIQEVGPWPSGCDVGNTVQACINASKDKTLSLGEFVRCPGNPASNRQVRMFAADGSHQCDPLDTPTGNDLLESAKTYMKYLNFVGLKDEQSKTKELLEWTFGMKVGDSVIQQEDTKGFSAMKDNDLKALVELAEDANKLDIELYQYASKLFHERYLNMKHILQK